MSTRGQEYGPPVNDDQGQRQGENQAICNFKPDYDLSTPGAQRWYNESQRQRMQPLDFNQDGTYTVKYGDSLSTIAERALKMTGQPINRQTIGAEVNAIIEANRDRYPTLECNADFIRDGWKLHIPKPGGQQPPIRVEPLPRPEPMPRPEPLPRPEYPPFEPPIRRPIEPPINCFPDFSRMGRPPIINMPGGNIYIINRGDCFQGPMYDMPMPRPEPFYIPRPEPYWIPRPMPMPEPGCGTWNRRQGPCHQTRNYNGSGRIPPITDRIPRL